MPTPTRPTGDSRADNAIIDFFDTGSKELVWRGSAEGKLHETADPAKRQERVNQGVQKILAQFPPNR